jgi:hypothetical protein
MNKSSKLVMITIRKAQSTTQEFGHCIQHQNGLEHEQFSGCDFGCEVHASSFLQFDVNNQ